MEAFILDAVAYPYFVLAFGPNDPMGEIAGIRH
jgi:hypothetical protein